VYNGVRFDKINGFLPKGWLKMCRLILKGRVLDVNHSSGVNYCRFNDIEQGGEISVSIPGAEGSIEIDSRIDIDAIIKPGRGKFGQYLKLVKLNSSENQEKKGGDTK